MDFTQNFIEFVKGPLKYLFWGGSLVFGIGAGTSLRSGAILAAVICFIAAFLCILGAYACMTIFKDS